MNDPLSVLAEHLDLDRIATDPRVDVQLAALNFFAFNDHPEPVAEKVTAGRPPRRHLPETAPAVLSPTGDPHAGKDVIADYLSENYIGVARMAFSDCIVREVNRYVGPFGYEVTVANKSLPVYRHLLQAWGMARRSENPQHWVEQIRVLVAKLQENADLVIVTGARVQTDVDLIHELGGQLWRVVRPGNDYRAEHAVEAGLSHLNDSDYDAIVYNCVEGDLGAFHENIAAVLHGRPQPHLPVSA